jgi:hypothetical protein
MTRRGPGGGRRTGPPCSSLFPMRRSQPPRRLPVPWYTVDYCRWKPQVPSGVPVARVGGSRSTERAIEARTEKAPPTRNAQMSGGFDLVNWLLILGRLLGLHCMEGLAGRWITKLGNCGTRPGSRRPTAAVAAAALAPAALAASGTSSALPAITRTRYCTECLSPVTRTPCTWQPPHPSRVYRPYGHPRRQQPPRLNRRRHLPPRSSR